MRRTLEALVVGCLSLGAVTGAFAASGKAVALDTRHHHAVRSGHLQGVAAENPFVKSPADGQACTVQSACASYDVTAALPKGRQTGELTINVATTLPSAVTAYSLRLLDAHGNVIGTTTDLFGTEDDSQPIGTVGSDLVADISPGRYTVQIKLLGGSADYTATFDWAALAH